MNRADLVSTLELASYALAADAMVPVFQCFCFQNETVWAYNDHLGIVAACDVEGAEGFAVNGATLRDLLKNSRTEEVDFTLEKGHLVVSAGKGSFKLPYFTTEEFLFEAPKDDWDLSMSLDEGLIKGLGVCLLTASKDNTQAALMGVSLNASGKELCLYSCDGDAITRFNTGAKAKNVKRPYMLPNAFCEAVIKVFGETKAESGTLEVNGEWAKATMANGYIVYGRIVENDNEFDFEANIKKTVKGDQEVVALPMELSDALARARVLGDPESKPTMISIAKGKMALVTETHMGVVRDSLTIRGHGDAEAVVSAALVHRSIGVCSHMAVHENCCVFSEGDTLFQIVSNLNE